MDRWKVPALGPKKAACCSDSIHPASRSQALFCVHSSRAGWSAKLCRKGGDGSLTRATSVACSNYRIERGAITLPNLMPFTQHNHCPDFSSRPDKDQVPSTKKGIFSAWWLKEAIQQQTIGLIAKIRVAGLLIICSAVKGFEVKHT